MGLRPQPNKNQSNSNITNALLRTYNCFANTRNKEAKLWRKFFKPRLAKLIQPVKHAGKALVTAIAKYR